MKNNLSASSYKSLKNCPARQVAIDEGRFKFKTTTPMLVGGYVDSYFSGTLENFKQENPQIFKKDGNLYSDFKQAEDIIQVIKADPMLLDYISGKQQVEVKGKIGGVEFIGYIDSLHEDKIVDLKIIADIHGKVWDDEQRKYVLWVEAFGYDVQLAIYRELIRQQTDKLLPCYLACVTKQSPPDKALLEVPQERMDFLIEEIKEKAPELIKLRNGEVYAERCEKCDFCRSTKMLLNTISVYELIF